MRTTPRSVAMIIAVLASTPIVSTAQQTQATASEEVMAVVKKVFDGMRTRDTALMRSVFDTGTRLVTTATRNGQPFVRETKINDFINIIAGAPPADTLNETIYDSEVRMDGNLATVWTRYDFHVNSRFSHCGVDAFQLARTASGWKIIALADTQRREGCKAGG